MRHRGGEPVRRHARAHQGQATTRLCDTLCTLVAPNGASWCSADDRRDRVLQQNIASVGG